VELLVFDDIGAHPAVLQALASEGHRVHQLASDDGRTAGDVVLLDAARWSEPQATKLTRRLPHAELILFVDNLDYKAPTDAAMALLKPVDVNKLVRLLRVVGEARSGRTDPRDLVDFETLFSGDSPAIVELLRRVSLLAESDASVWLHGELGSGRAVVARAIHDRSQRHGKAFMAVNAASFPGDLLEEHLFSGERPIALRAHGGTLFIDSVTELAPGVQAKLMRLIDERRMRLGGTDYPVDVRIMVGDERRTLNVGGRLRRDLHQRLRVHEIDLPPLRERADDLSAIIRRLLERLRSDDAKAGLLSNAATRCLEAYPFPGNIRELAYALTHAVVLAQGGQIELEHLPIDIQRQAPAEPVELDPADLEPLDAVAKRFERTYLLRVLRAVGGNRTRAAKILDLSRKGLWQKLKAHGIAADEGRDDDD
jgi:DNA-binding NtrC family response regulator